MDNAIQMALKELNNRFDFKGIKTEISSDRKQKTLTLFCAVPEKLEALKDVLHGRLIKRGISTLSLDYQKEESATGASVRQKALVHSGISKEKGKEIIKELKNTKLRVQGQIQDEQVRVTAKQRDELQEAITFLKSKQDALKLPMQFGNFRD